MDFQEIRKVNATIAGLRASGLLRDAIELVKVTVPGISDKEDRVPILTEGLRAAQELKDDDVVRQFASEILAIDSGVPSARKALGLN
jgi:hypothetical protein